MIVFWLIFLFLGDMNTDARTDQVPPDARWKLHRQLNSLILSLLLISCVFFACYDVLVEHIWWSSFFLYFPFGGLFVFGLLAWRRLHRSWLLAFGLILIAVDLFLFGYGSWLWTQEEFLWGPLTLGFSLFTVALSWSSIWMGRKLRHES
jgi:hypothetical protein